jgi:hypothetical protein
VLNHCVAERQRQQLVVQVGKLLAWLLFCHRQSLVETVNG